MFRRLITCRGWVAVVVVVALAHASAADAQVTLSHKYPETSTHKTRLSVQIEQSLSLGGQSLDTKVDTTVSMSTDYGMRNDQGALPVAVTFESIKTNLELPGGNAFEFDSEKPDDTDSDNPVAQILLDVLRKQAGMKLEYLLGPDNQVGEIQGLPEGTLTSAKSMRRDFQQAADMFPDKPVKIGDTWQRTTHSDVGNGQIITLGRRFEYLGAVPEFPTLSDSRQLEKIGVKCETVDFTIDPDGGLPLTVEKADLKIASSGGTILFDRQSGRIVSQTDSIRIQGELALGAAGMILEGALDLTMQSKVTETD